MGEAASKAAKTTNYSNAGTVEFLFQDGQFYFLEMNTRLQVEHGVTEMVCGIDLVKWQIRVANDERLDFTQKDIKQRGHAIECRIYAEDPSRNFLPTPGRVRKLVLPEGPGIRNDVGILEGQEVTSAYDPLLAKLVVWDSTRLDSINKMDYALSNFVILGLITNQPFLREIMQDSTYRKASFSTKYIDEHFSDWVLDTASPEVFAACMLSNQTSQTSSVSKKSDSSFSPWHKSNWKQGF